MKYFNFEYNQTIFQLSSSLSRNISNKYVAQLSDMKHCEPQELIQATIPVFNILLSYFRLGMQTMEDAALKLTYFKSIIAEDPPPTDSNSQNVFFYFSFIFFFIFLFSSWFNTLAIS